MNASRRRASGLVRMLVVGSATLALLLVCFSIYQYWQNEISPAVESRPRTVRRRTEPSALQADARDMPTADVSDRGIGPGANVSITIYPREGSNARLEVEVRDWTPVSGVANEFELVEPKIRMLTSDHHAVRITARRSVLEARRRTGAALEPQRGKLTGGVLIEYDRLTEKQREALPPDQRDEVDPADIVRIETEEIEFDIEYAKLVIPGPFQLAARDVTLSAANLELHYNESENRIETLRIGGGGELDLLQLPGSAGLASRGDASQPPRTIVEWIRQTIQTKLAAKTVGVAPPGVDTTSPQEDAVEDGKSIPVFRAGDLEDNTPVAPVHYFAHFEGAIHVVQRRGETLVSRLRADSLDILRDFTRNDTKPEKQHPASGVTDKANGSAPPDAGAPLPPKEHISLTWSDRLVLNAISPDDERLRDGVRSRITATGSPTRLSSPEGDAACRRFVYDPDGEAVWLYGSELNPASVRQRGQGTLTGTVVHTRTEGDRFFVDITGPGELSTIADATDATAATTGAKSSALPDGTAVGPQATANQPAAIDKQVVSFRDRMQANGLVKSKTVMDFSGHISTGRYRVLKTATFSGQVSVGQEGVSMDADELTVRFGVEESWRGIRQFIDGFHGTGHVVMVQHQDRLTCHELDASLRTDHTGRIWPRTVVASGDIDAVQGERTISARDKLIVDFALYEEPHTPQTKPPPSNTSSSGSTIVAGTGATNLPLAVKAPSTVAVDSRVVRTGIERLQASGVVHVTDATQRLDLSAETLDCRIALRRGEIERATVAGITGQPATVRLEDVTATGQHINVNVADEWMEIPGAGRMSMLSYRDLDGTRVTTPVPLVINWNTGMRYQGRKNRAVFGGHVHAYSRSTTTFDCQRLEIEFDEVSSASITPDEASWYRLPKWLDRLTGHPSKPNTPKQRFNREPAVIWATGHAKAITSDIDEHTGEMKTRMRIEGPKLAVYLRPEVSKMLMEGGGTLLMEQFQSAPSTVPHPQGASGELFDMNGDNGPSKTLIEWKDTMVYDFGIDQTRFEGDVSLKHFSGEELQKRFGQATPSHAGSAPGRSTYLRCDILTVDFLEEGQRTRVGEDRMGRLSTASLRQFEASGSVRLNDTSEGLQVWADKIIYEKPRQLLAIYGELHHKARIIKRRPQRLPLQMDLERLFYNLKTGLPEIADLEVR